MGNNERILRGAIIGCGFWAQYQIAAWLELDHVELVAVYNRTRSKANDLARRFGIPAVYDDIGALFENEHLDFVDIITDVDTHAFFVKEAIKRSIPVICQKPMAPDVNVSRELVRLGKNTCVPFFIHENFRWQTPMRRLRTLLDEGRIGKVFKARIAFCSHFPVFDNQPFLASLERFILMDIGSHVLDIARFLLGEAKSMYCLTNTINPRIKGEDVADILMEMRSGAHCAVELSYASLLEEEVFPQTLVRLEGTLGTAEICAGHVLKVTTDRGTISEKAEPIAYAWADPAYALVHASIVEINRNFRDALQGKGVAETDAQDNFKTMQLVYDAYESAVTGKVITY